MYSHLMNDNLHAFSFPVLPSPAAENFFHLTAFTLLAGCDSVENFVHVQDNYCNSVCLGSEHPCQIQSWSTFTLMQSHAKWISARVQYFRLSVLFLTHVYLKCDSDRKFLLHCPCLLQCVLKCKYFCNLLMLPIPLPTSLNSQSCLQGEFVIKERSVHFHIVSYSYQNSFLVKKNLMLETYNVLNLSARHHLKSLNPKTGRNVIKNGCLSHVSPASNLIPVGSSVPLFLWELHALWL